MKQAVAVDDADKEDDDDEEDVTDGDAVKVLVAVDNVVEDGDEVNDAEVDVDELHVAVMLWRVDADLTALILPVPLERAERDRSALREAVAQTLPVADGDIVPPPLKLHGQKR